jgi:hypothetical protein
MANPSSPLWRSHRPAEESGVRLIRSTSAALAVALLGAAFAAAAQTASYPGDYAGTGKQVKVLVHVDDTAHGTLRYALRSECGRARGTLQLAPRAGRLTGKRVSAGPHRTVRRVTARIESLGDGTVLGGTIKEALSANGKRGPCQATRQFTATLNRTDTFVPPRDAGHYTGVGPGGLPISFDVVEGDDPRRALIKAIDVDVAGDCLNELTGQEFGIKTVHVRGLDGTIVDGDVEIDFIDGVNEYLLFGTISDGRARLEVSIDGYFDLDGTANPLGSIYCDNDEPTYTATRD